MRGLTIDLIARVAELEGELAALKSIPQRTFADVTRSSEAKRHSDPDPEEGKGEEAKCFAHQTERHREKDAAKVAEAELKKNFEPSQLGLKNVTLRKTRQGVLVLADEKEGLDRLKSELDTHEVLKSKLAAEFPEEDSRKSAFWGCRTRRRRQKSRKNLLNKKHGGRADNNKTEDTIKEEDLSNSNSSSPRSSIPKNHGARTCEDWMNNVQGKRKPVCPKV
ncbi:hypothetical protein HPB48_019664 [Haemaphysalis longicornis]|uniref:Uncharacterized protein n=1 Tax=Haemaphysalis longicornis TaxID=44386 RepID=A0A9J6G518_HAELO|nr:hypothetical protein HPB48_019664 [Haemaphysalis longicornis]